MTSPVTLWFRRDLRLTDNQALTQALSSGASIIPVFIFDERILNSKRLGLPRLKFMLAALESLDAGLRQLGTRLIVRHGDPFYELQKIIADSQATAVYFNEDYTPFAQQRDDYIQHNLAAKVIACPDMLIHPPNSILKADGTPYVVYTPFKRQWFQRPVQTSTPRALNASDFWQGEIATQPLPTLKDLGFSETIQVLPASESEAQHRFEQFKQKALFTYETGRNHLAPDVFNADEGTSILSPYLRFGLISPRQLYNSAQTAIHNTDTQSERISIETWLSELAWRDFYQHILWHFPQVKTQNFRTVYDALAWRDAPSELARWQDGLTGYPIVDAAMRQLKAQSWMPNRARMIVASFLTKNLLIDWRRGEQYFMEWLIDGDLAANNGGWQWTAGTGTDAQPYFRIFNPISQSQKFDLSGDYIRAWIPELAEVELANLHTPWELSQPPKNYPAPIVEHHYARQRALTAYKQARGGSI